MLLPLRNLAVNNVPAHCCAILTKTPFLELPLILAFTVAMLAACSLLSLPDVVLHHKPVDHDASQRLISGDVQRTERFLVDVPIRSHRWMVFANDTEVVTGDV